MIRRIRIQNFKSLADVTVELGDVTVLIGRSGTGKSNFVEAIRFLRDALRNRWEANKASSNSVHWNTQLHSMCFTFGVTPAMGSTSYEYTYGWNMRNGADAGFESLASDAGKLFEQAAAKWKVRPAGVASPGNPRVPYVQPNAELPDAELVYAILGESMGCYDFPGNIFCQAPKSAMPRREFLDDGSNYLETAIGVRQDPRRGDDWKTAVGALRRLQPSLVDVQFPTGDPPVVVRKSTAGYRRIELSRESEGFRRMFAHLLALYQNPPKQLLVFEEPEKGIYPYALQTLAEEIKAAPKEGRGQVILTTHSPQLLDWFDEESIRVVEIQDGVTTINRLAEDQREALREKLLSPGELLTVDEPVSKREVAHA